MIIITAKAHPVLSDTFRERGENLYADPEISYESLLDIIAEATGLIVTTRIKIDRVLIDRAVKLKWIGSSAPLGGEMPWRPSSSCSPNCP